MGGRQGQKDAASQTRPISTAGGRRLREEPRLPKVKASAAATTEVGELSPPRCATNRVLQETNGFCYLYSHNTAAGRTGTAVGASLVPTWN
ncbi:hypothetical protein NDU88_001034 [Pleurodeles waltl]|uniref:Uncharacterized protein n=1 Tax=Pleurodeles waltl TaxID=8319 RepID=A0AAV7WH76_PLEWA|nr:hypothetical protein NDU88_001034 [Pleurodeles waltl]